MAAAPVKSPVESKVKAATGGAVGGAAASTLVLWILGCLLFGSPWDASHVDDALAAVPSPLAILVTQAAPAAAAYFAGFQARHTLRPDLSTDAGVEVTVDAQPDSAPVEPNL